MKSKVAMILFCFCAIQLNHSQEDNGVLALNIPVRTSLTFNRFAINPTFSFVREQNKYVSLYNKREWVQFDDAPNTYMASFSGRLAENLGAGIGAFQQNYGVLTAFGGVVNVAYNVRLARESNLTFGMNIGAYSSGINTGNVVTNFNDPALQNVPESFLLTVNPGINYGTTFLDFGVSVNNLAVYNFRSSNIIQDHPERGIQGHIMYTGYMNSRGFLADAKFSGLLKSEFRSDDTIVSGMVMLTVPKGIWAQAGYNTLYGASAGLGINLTSQIAIEYNFEKALGDLTDFGSSHDITLAYRFKTRERYDYSSGDEISGLISTKRKIKPLSKAAKEKAEANRILAEQRNAEAKLVETENKKENDASEAQEQAKILAEQKTNEEAKAKAEAEQKAKDEEARQLEEQKAQEEAAERERIQAELKAKQAAEAKAKELTELKAKAEAEEQVRLLEEQKAKEEAEEEARLLEEQKAKEEAEEQARLLEEQKAKEKADEEAKLLEEQKSQEEAIAKRISNPSDTDEAAMLALKQKIETSKLEQDQLLSQYDNIVEVKDQDLKDLKEENDLSEQGFVVTPKPFKSVEEEDQRLQAIIDELDMVIEARSQEIAELKELYENKKEDEDIEVDTIYLDEVLIYYKKTIDRLEAEQIAATQEKIKLQLRLEEIRVATEFEKNRRIKRAAFNNEEDRYEQDRATLENIKKNTDVQSMTLTEDDFDFGEVQSGSIQILKNVDKVDNGYYLIMAVHTDLDKRNDFVTKVVASGRKDVDFFYDVNTSKYYIYYEKFDGIEAANRALEDKDPQPYNKNVSLIKIEN